jgi:hypothetical protein
MVDTPFLGSRHNPYAEVTSLPAWKFLFLLGFAQRKATQGFAGAIDLAGDAAVAQYWGVFEG